MKRVRDTSREVTVTVASYFECHTDCECGSCFVLTISLFPLVLHHVMWDVMANTIIIRIKVNERNMKWEGFAVNRTNEYEPQKEDITPCLSLQETCRWGFARYSFDVSSFFSGPFLSLLPSISLFFRQSIFISSVLLLSIFSLPFVSRH